MVYSSGPDRAAQLAEHWASIPKVLGSILTLVRLIRGGRWEFWFCEGGAQFHWEQEVIPNRWVLDSITSVENVFLNLAKLVAYY